MRKYFYFVATDPMDWVDKEGNAANLGDPEALAGQTRELAREIKRYWYDPSDKPVICKFDRNHPYKFLGVVS